MESISKLGGNTDEKIKNISEYLKSNVLNPAEDEKRKILESAKQEKEKIIAEAKRDAKNILKEAEETSEKIRQNMESSLKIAAKQAIDTLKQALEKEVLSQTIKEPVNDALSSEEVVKELISLLVDIYLNKKDDEKAELIVAEKMKTKLEKFLKNQIIKKSKGRIVLSEDGVLSGFSVVLEKGRLVYDFSEESVTELLSEFLREDLRHYLFNK